MAQDTVTAKENGGKGLPEWRKARIESTEAVWRNILDPILTFAELMNGYSKIEDGSEINLTLAEISAVLRLLILGGYTETKLHCTGWTKLSHTSGDSLENELKDWKE